MKDLNIKICLFDRENQKHRKQLANLLAEVFPKSYGDCPEKEAEKCLAEEKIAILALDGDNLVGFVGAIAQYGVTAWELHPLAVKKEYQHQGIGTKLIKALEQEVAFKGGVTIYLGTDDEFGRTSLSNINLYDDLFEKIKNIKNLKDHPFEFYQKVGYQIVGVIPDANGIGKPDIFMAKRIK